MRFLIYALVALVLALSSLTAHAQDAPTQCYREIARSSRDGAESVSVVCTAATNGRCDECLVFPDPDGVGVTMYAGSGVLVPVSSRRECSWRRVPARETAYRLTCAPSVIAP